MHTIVPIETLRETPLKGAVAAIDLKDTEGGLPQLPEGSNRFTITIDGTESDDLIRSLKVLMQGTRPWYLRGHRVLVPQRAVFEGCKASW